MKAVILAGGKGVRLKPYTTHFPKPLMPVGDKPILEILIEKLKEAEIYDIIITTGHLSEMINVLMGDGSKVGVKIKYSLEDKPLGTAGPLDLLRDDLTEDFILINGDVLSDLNFSEMIKFHKKNNNAATIGSIERTVFVDFGLVKLDSKNMYQGWEEKPTLKYLVSMGIYVLSPLALNCLPKGEFFNIPDLIQALHNNNEKVMGYKHKGYWLDIGRREDYESACKSYNENSDIK
ncbi:MAG: nucleoside-diphosphate-sugar pyrophosphorylase [Ignavibacteria bacterium RBG_16_34_14]|nr:MAG: nucleoside-diphosphate-sugar pyrophosphorylase [Ignavibacteria bacterium RBG_16_34_14]